jgi:para-nitrobenzyl esterase
MFMMLDPRHTWNLFGLLPRYRDEQQYQAAADAVDRSWNVFGADAPAAAMLRSGATDVYVYRFDWRGEPRPLGTDLPGLMGAAHALEIQFVLGNFEFAPMADQIFNDENRAERLQLSDAMMSYWGTFAREGRPGGAWTPAPRVMVLDAASAGGQRMAPEMATFDAVIAGVHADARFKTQKARCAALHDLSYFRQLEPTQAYALVSRGACADYPFEQYPWR